MKGFPVLRVRTRPYYAGSTRGGVPSGRRVVVESLLLLLIFIILAFLHHSLLLCMVGTQ